MKMYSVTCCFKCMFEQLSQRHQFSCESINKDFVLCSESEETKHSLCTRGFGSCPTKLSREPVVLLGARWGLVTGVRSLRCAFEVGVLGPFLPYFLTAMRRAASLHYIHAPSLCLDIPSAQSDRTGQLLAENLESVSQRNFSFI